MCRRLAVRICPPGLVALLAFWIWWRVDGWARYWDGRAPETPYGCVIAVGFQRKGAERVRWSDAATVTPLVKQVPWTDPGTGWAPQCVSGSEFAPVFYTDDGRTLKLVLPVDACARVYPAWIDPHGAGTSWAATKLLVTLKPLVEPYLSREERAGLPWWELVGNSS